VALQVSCGPYHTCAVSSDGRLFSWGDGLCGKLGHASSDNCTEPRQVSSLADQSVLHVSCGVWHTACIARPQQSQDQAGSVSYLEGPATGSISFEDSSGVLVGGKSPFMFAAWTVGALRCSSCCLVQIDMHFMCCFHFLLP